MHSIFLDWCSTYFFSKRTFFFYLLTSQAIGVNDFVFKSLTKLILQITTFANYYYSCKLMHRSFKTDDIIVPIIKDNALLLIPFCLKNIDNVENYN